MQRHLYLEILALAALASVACLNIAHAAMHVVPGEWITRNTVMTPEGPKTMTQRQCNRGADVTDLFVKHQKNVVCTVGKISGPDSSGAYLLHDTCVPPGAPAGGSTRLSMLARVTVAPDGRSVHGMVRATDTVNGRSFTVPPTRFTSDYAGSCPGR